MVQSRIDNTVNYVETKTIFDEDNGHSSSLYEIDYTDGIPIAISLGKMRTEKKGIVYYPIYIVGEDKKGELVIRSQIGVFEIPENDCLSVLDEENEMCLDKSDPPLYYSFVNEAFIKKAKSYPSKYHSTKSKEQEQEKEEKTKDTKNSKQEKEEKTKDTNNMKDTVDDIFSVDVVDTPENRTIREKLKNGVFEPVRNEPEHQYLEEETKNMADEITKQYRESEKDPWIQKYMKNANYDIVEVKSNGDCLFDVIVQSYKSIGKTTTVSKLRAVVAEQLTNSIFNNYYERYRMFTDMNQSLETDIKTLKGEIQDPIMKEKIKTETNKSKQKNMVKEVNEKINKYNEKVEERKMVISNLEGYKHMKDIKSLEDYKRYIMTSNYWADEWSIFVLEQFLKIKMVIFSEETYEQGTGDIHHVIRCGHTIDEVKRFVPEFYIMTTYSGNHYRLISYKNKKIFTFTEIPYHTKVLIVKQCMIGQNGIYQSIEDFSNFKVSLNIVEHELSVMKGGKTDMYDEDIVFTFHKNAYGKPLPGKGVNEKIPEYNMDFVRLAKIQDWRKKLDDSWEQHHLLRVDNKMWNSVDHYVLGTQYQKKYPNVYAKFSVDSGSDISKDLVLAKSSIQEDGVVVNGEKMDAKREEEEKESRETAVREKFTQNEDFKELLLSTKNALLQKFIPSVGCKPDDYLMTLRQKIQRQ